MVDSDSTRARVAWLASAACFLAAPAFADQQPDLCGQLALLADAGRDGRVHQVRLVWKEGGEVAACKAHGAVERRICRWIRRDESARYFVSFSQDALGCLGRDPLPPEDPDPDVVALDAHWTKGAFHVESGPLLREGQRFTMELDLDPESGPSWILFTARPK